MTESTLSLGVLLGDLSHIHEQNTPFHWIQGLSSLVTNSRVGEYLDETRHPVRVLGTQDT